MANCLRLFTQVDETARQSIRQPQQQGGNVCRFGHAKMAANYNLEKLTVDVFVKKNEHWYACDGILDSGASFTCGSLQNHAVDAQIEQISENSALPVGFYDANGKLKNTVGYWKTDLVFKFQTISFKLIGVTICIVDSPNWSTLSLGREVLQRLDIDPLTLLYRKLTNMLEANRRYERLRKLRQFYNTNYKKLQLERKNYKMPRSLWFQVVKLGLTTNAVEQISEVLPEIYDILENKKAQTHVIGIESKLNWIISATNTPSEFNFVLGKVNLGNWWFPPLNGKPIICDITTQPITELVNGHLYDVIVMDPPWNLDRPSDILTTTNRAAGLSDKDIMYVDFSALLTPKAKVFIWTPPQKKIQTLDMLKAAQMTVMDEIGWTYVDDPVLTNGRILQTRFETCLVAMRKTDLVDRPQTRLSNVIHAPQRQPNRKPYALYAIIEELWPESAKLEIFGRAWNIRNGWTTIGSFK